jgi:hypothetical protein
MSTADHQGQAVPGRSDLSLDLVLGLARSMGWVFRFQPDLQLKVFLIPPVFKNLIFKNWVESKHASFYPVSCVSFCQILKTKKLLISSFYQFFMIL